jgi:signal transduction histidine kinase
MRWIHRLPARMAASYLLVTLTAAILVEAAFVGLVVSPLLSADEVTARLQATAQEQAKLASLRAQQLGHLPTPAEYVIGDPGAAGTDWAATDRGVFVVPYHPGPVPDGGPPIVALLVAPSGIVVNSSYPSRYRVGSPIRKLAPYLPPGTHGSGVSGARDGAVRWTTADVVTKAAPGGATGTGGQIGSIYLQVPVAVPASRIGQLAPAIRIAPWVLLTALPVGMFFGLVSTRGVVRRVRRLARGSLRVADGDLAFRLDVRGRDEIGEAETNFNRMAAQLEQALAVQRRAAEHTARRAERARISRELHDSITQSLFSLRLLAGGVRRALPAESPLRAHMTEMESTADRVVREIRALLLELRPIALHDAGLVAALTELASAYLRLGVRADLAMPDSAGGLPLPAQHTLLRVTQEAMSNAVRHGAATTVSVRLAVAESAATLTVTDNGTGFDPSAPTLGLGLDLMRERAADCGARLDVESGVGHGTTIRLTIPAGTR